MCIRNKIFFICLLVLFACAPVRVKIHPEEAPSVKSAPGKTVPENAPPARPYQARIPPEAPLGDTLMAKTYRETVSGWKSYQDLVKWMEKNFSTDMDRFRKFEGTLPVPRTPGETFQLKSGIYIDAIIFLKETLDRIDPLYQAKVVLLLTRPYRFNHYVCSFKKDKKIFIMDYGTPYREMTGVHGPYRSLEEYKKFYEGHHPAKREVEAITYLP
jgi:hypothetical protein